MSCRRLKENVPVCINVMMKISLRERGRNGTPGGLWQGRGIFLNMYSVIALLSYLNISFYFIEYYFARNSENGNTN